MTDLPPERREELAEALSVAAFDFTAYSETAHPDHNRWSWRGDGHGEQRRQECYEAADALAPVVAAMLAVARAEGAAASESTLDAVIEREREAAWHAGHDRWCEHDAETCRRLHDPYRAALAAPETATGQEVCECGHNAWTEHGGIMAPPNGCDLCPCVLNEQQAADSTRAALDTPDPETTP